MYAIATGGLIILLVVVLSGFLFGLWILARILVSRMAHQDILFTFRKEGHIKSLVEGERLIKYLYKLPGLHVDKDTGDVTPIPGENSALIDDQFTWVEKIFGAYWIGFPPREILDYGITYARPIRPDDIQKHREDPGHYMLDEEHNLVRRSTTTTYHAWRQIYSIYVSKVEIKGFTKDEKGDQTEGQVLVDFWGTFTLLTRNVRIPVQELEGKWFSHDEDAIRGAISDHYRGKDLDEVRNAAKSSPQYEKDEDGENKLGSDGKPIRIPSAFEQAIMDASLGSSGTIATTGQEIVAFNFAGYQVAEGDVEAALKAKSIATLKADARAQDGRGEGDFERLRREGIAAGDRKQVDALKGDPVAASVLIARARAEGMRDYTATGTYVEGGAPIAPVLPLHRNTAPAAVGDNQEES